MNTNKQSEIRKKMYQNAMANRVPIVGTFELTPRCNMNCNICYARLNERDMCGVGKECSAEEWIRIGQECRDAGMLFLLLTGGEPFLRKDFKEIYIGLNKLGLIITINTNGSMIDENTIDWLKKCPPSKMNITLYGASNATYEKMCGLKNGFDKVARTIDLLMAANIRVAINATITKENVKELEGIYSFAKARKLSVKETVYLFPPVSEIKENKVLNYRLNPEEAGEVLFYGKKNQMSEELFGLYVAQMKGKLEKNDENPTKNLEEGCMAGKASFSVTWNGKIKLCGMIPEHSGDLLHESFDSCWSKVMKAGNGLKLPYSCIVCKKRPYCTVCKAVINVECSSCYENPPEYMCRITESYINNCLKHI